jgi:hypothetical protein
LNVSVLGGFGLLIAIEVLTRGIVQTVLFYILGLAIAVLMGLVVRFWLTTTRQYLGERRRRGLKIYGRYGRFVESFAEEDRSHPVTDKELARRKAQRRKK